MKTFTAVDKNNIGLVSVWVDSAAEAKLRIAEQLGRPGRDVFKPLWAETKRRLTENDWNEVLMTPVWIIDGAQVDSLSVAHKIQSFGLCFVDCDQ